MSILTNCTARTMKHLSATNMVTEVGADKFASTSSSSALTVSKYRDGISYLYAMPNLKPAHFVLIWVLKLQCRGALLPLHSRLPKEDGLSESRRHCRWPLSIRTQNARSFLHLAR